MKKIIILILSLTLLLVGCQSNETGNQAINNEVQAETTQEVALSIEYGDYEGYMWEVTQGDATVYMFGSIHMADESLYPMSEKVEKAFYEADVLGVEADISDGKAVEATLPLMLYKGEETVYDHLSHEGIDKFESICKEVGVNPLMLQRFKVWALGSNLLALQLNESPYSALEGVDMYFLQKANEMNKEIVALEGLEYQINLINDFTDDEQESAFLLGLGTTEETVADFNTMYELYLAADDDKMTDYLFSGEGGFTDDVEDMMLRDRNVLMTEKIESYLETDKTYFVVVGLAHYLGEDSVIKMLNDKGYDVKRK